VSFWSSKDVEDRATAKDAFTASHVAASPHSHLWLAITDLQNKIKATKNDRLIAQYQEAIKFLKEKISHDQ